MSPDRRLPRDRGSVKAFSRARRARTTRVRCRASHHSRRSRAAEGSPMGTVRRRLGNERGSVAAIMAVVLMVMLALSALAIDLAALRDARAEAQRSADVIALAGAAAFR